MTQVPHGPDHLSCPFHRKPMSAVCHKCPMWVHVRGRNPNTGEEMDQWNCSLAWLPMLLLENAQQTREVGGAIESFRNESLKQGWQATQVLVRGAHRLNEQEPPKKLEAE
jgi:hypothetical protein